MAEAGKRTEEEVGVVGEAENGEKESSDMGSDTCLSFLSELNLILIVWFLSSSAEERLDLEEKKKEKESDEEEKGKKSSNTSRSTPQTKPRSINQFKAVQPRFAKPQTKIRDCRHCRRL